MSYMKDLPEVTSHLQDALIGFERNFPAKRGAYNAEASRLIEPVQIFAQYRKDVEEHYEEGTDLDDDSAFWLLKYKENYLITMHGTVTGIAMYYLQQFGYGGMTVEELEEMTPEQRAEYEAGGGETRHDYLPSWNRSLDDDRPDPNYGIDE